MYIRYVSVRPSLLGPGCSVRIGRPAPASTTRSLAPIRALLPLIVVAMPQHIVVRQEYPGCILLPRGTPFTQDEEGRLEKNGITTDSPPKPGDK